MTRSLWDGNTVDGKSGTWNFWRIFWPICQVHIHHPPPWSPLPTCESLASSLFHIDFAPQASDSSLLLGSKMHHDVKSWSLQVITEASEASLCYCCMLQPLFFTAELLLPAPPCPLKSLVKVRLCPSGVESGQLMVSKKDVYWVYDNVLVPETSFLC